MDAATVSGITNVAFLPKNQPLYSLACFALVPSFLTSALHVRPPEVMRSLMSRLSQSLALPQHFPNIRVSYDTHESFVRMHTQEENGDPLAPEVQPDVVLFCGTAQVADRLRRIFPSD